MLNSILILNIVPRVVKTSFITIITYLKNHFFFSSYLCQKFPLTLNRKFEKKIIENTKDSKIAGDPRCPILCAIQLENMRSFVPVIYMHDKVPERKG